MKIYIILIAILVALCVSCDDSRESTNASGYIDGDTDWDCISLYTDDTDIDVVFTWPQGEDFMVTAFGRGQNYLGEFHLLGGNTINLTGGGQFFLLVHCLNGTGAWSASW